MTVVRIGDEEADDERDPMAELQNRPATESVNDPDEQEKQYK